MKKSITLKRLGAIFVIIFSVISYSSAAGIQTVNEAFPAIGNWDATKSANSSATLTNGHLNVTMGLQTNAKYRGDIWYNFAGTAANNITLNPANDVYLAIKFIGARPSGVLKMEFYTGTTWFNTQWNGGSADGNLSTTSNNKIYYFRLTKDANYIGTAITLNKLHFILADANVAPFSYVVDWVGTFTSVADITAYADTQDDGAGDTDEGSIDPATLGGYINNQFLGNVDGWEKNVNEKVIWNDGKLMFKSTSADLQAKKTNVNINATNFPYLAVKIDKFPVGSTRFKLQTNCSATSVYDSWYSVVAQKGDVYVFDMANCVNKNTNATQAAITSTNAADLWIDFGETTIGEMAQIAWVKTYQTLAEIPTETSSPTIAESDINAGAFLNGFDTENLSTTSWDWMTTHWQGGEAGCKVSSTNGKLVMEPNASTYQVSATTRNFQTLNTTNYPLLAIKVSDIGDGVLFKFGVSSITKGSYVKYSNDASFVTLINNIYVFDISSLPTVATATDINLRLDFYKDLLATTNPTLPVNIDWIQSYRTIGEINSVLTSTIEKTNSNIYAFVEGSSIVVKGVASGRAVVVYDLSGQVVKQVIASSNETILNLKSGLYMVKVGAKVMKVVL